MKKILLLTLLIPCLSWAAPKGISIEKSGFDGTTEITMRSYGTSSCAKFGGACLMLGANWKNSNPDEVVLELSTLNYFAAMSNLLLNIDGEIIKADRINFAHDSTLTGNYKESYQRFKIDKQTLTKILNAKRVWLKVSISGGNYLETNLIDEGKKTLAFEGLTRFESQLN